MVRIHIRVVFGRNSWKFFEERYVMKENLSRKEITRCIGNGFEVYMEYKVDWVAKILKNW